MINSVEQYLALLRTELSKTDAATIQDALADAEEHLRTALAGAREKQPEFTESHALASIIEQYGSPSETAAAYAEIERRTPPGLTPHEQPPRAFLKRFFGVYADARAWGALLYMLIAMVTGILYFTWAVTGLSLSITLSIFIFGLPFALLFLLSVRGLALLEGRVVEALLGVRMPRRPLFGHPGLRWLERLKLLVTDKTVWLAILYMLVQMPLGVVYFSLAVILVTVSISFMAAPVVQLVWNIPIMMFNEHPIFLPYGSLLLLSVLGFLMLTLTMYLARGISELHGRYARWMLVTE
jgi:uncharacterized membrane protein